MSRYYRIELEPNSDIWCAIKSIVRCDEQGVMLHGQQMEASRRTKDDEEYAGRIASEAFMGNLLSKELGLPVIMMVVKMEKDDRIELLDETKPPVENAGQSGSEVYR